MLFPSQTKLHTGGGNELFVWSPTPMLKFQPSALRSHRYQMTDDFVGEAADILSRNTTGREDATRHLLNEARRQSVVSFHDRPQAMFDYNPFNEHWKFVLILRDFPGSHDYARYTVVLTGLCSDEPILRSGKASDRCELLVQNRTVIQSYASVGASGHGVPRHRTRSDTSMVYGHLVGATASRADLCENRPSSFNYNPGLGGMADQPVFSADPQMDIGSNDYGAGPVSFNRFTNDPNIVMRDLVDTISTSLRTRRSSGGFGGADIMTTTHDPIYDVASIAEDFQQADRQGGTVTAHIGPKTDQALSLRTLQRDYGINDIYVAHPAQEAMYTEEDPAVASVRNMYYGLLESLLPAFASNSQIMSMYMEVTTEVGEFGKERRVPRIREVHSFVENMPSQELSDRAYRMFDELEASVFVGLANTVGAFQVTIDLDMTGRSYINLCFFDEDNNPDAAYSFTCGYNNFAVPMIGTREGVRENQSNLGNMLMRVFSEQDYSSQTLLDLTSEENYDDRPSRREPPRTIRTEEEFAAERPSSFRGFDSRTPFDDMDFRDPFSRGRA